MAKGTKKSALPALAALPPEKIEDLKSYIDKTTDKLYAHLNEIVDSMKDTSSIVLAGYSDAGHLLDDLKEKTEKIEQLEQDIKDKDEEIEELELVETDRILPGNANIDYRANSILDEFLMKAVGDLLESSNVNEVTDLLEKLADPALRRYVLAAIDAFDLL